MKSIYQKNYHSKQTKRLRQIILYTLKEINEGKELSEKKILQGEIQN